MALSKARRSSPRYAAIAMRSPERACAARERPPAHLRVHRQHRLRHRLEVGRHLPVPELAHVEVALAAVERVRVEPAEHDVTRRLEQALAFDDALAMVAVLAAAAVRLQHRGIGLLDLQEERVGVVLAEHEEDPAAGADAAHADDLARQVDHPVALEQVAPVGLEAVAVDAELLVEPGLERRGIDVARRARRSGTSNGASLAIRTSPSTTSVSFAKAFMLSLVSAFATTLVNRVTLGCLHLARVAVEHALRRRGARTRRRGWSSPRSSAIASRYDCAAFSTIDLAALRRELPRSGRDLEAGGEALDVPLERAVARLVEVVDVEDEPALGRMRTRRSWRGARRRSTARASPVSGTDDDVGRHHDCRASVERERRREHALVPDGHELGTRVSSWPRRSSTGSRRSAGGSHAAWLAAGPSCVPPCHVRRARRPRGARPEPAPPRTSWSSSALSALGSRLLRIFGFGEQRPLRRS